MMFEDDSVMITLVVFEFFLSKTVFEGKYGSSQSPKSISISMEHFLLKQHDSCDWVLDLDIVPPSAIFSFRPWQLSSSAAIFLHNDDTMKKSNVWKIIMILIKTAGNFQSNKHSACVTADDLQHTRHKYESNNFTFSRGVRKILLDVKKRDDGWYRNLPRMRRGFEFHWQCKRF